MAQLLYANNAVSRLRVDVPALSTTVQLPTGEGGRFPQPAAGDWFKLTLDDRRTNQLEITHCTARAGDILTVVRGQEGTLAQGFTAGAVAANRVTAGTMSYFQGLIEGAAGYTKAESDTRFINADGDTMTGPLKGVAPGANDDLTRKDYVDSAISTLPPGPHTHPIPEVTGLQSALDGKEPLITAPNDAFKFWNGTKSWANATWNAVTGKPSTFPPSAHTHAAVDIVNLDEAVDDRVSLLLKEGSNIDLAYDDTAGTLTITSTASGGGGGGAATYIGDEPPSSPTTGQLWFRSSSGVTYIWFDDGNSAQWVAAMAPLPSGVAGTTTVSTAWAPAASGLMVPFYLYPNNPYTDAAVQRLVGLMKQYHRVPVLVVINPSNGPGDVWDGNYAALTKVLQGAGGKVCGYVSTDYATRPEADVKADIDLWLTLYADARIDGIFLDEQTWETGPGNVGNDYVLLYERYTDHCHTAGLYPVIGNPGTNQQGAYFTVNTSDIIVVHENTAYPAEATMAGLYPGGHADFSYTRRAALVYNQPTLDGPSFTTLRKHTQWVYVTHDNLTGGLLNPWDELPTYLEGLFAALND